MNLSAPQLKYSFVNQFLRKLVISLFDVDFTYRIPVVKPDKEAKIINDNNEVASFEENWTIDRLMYECDQALTSFKLIDRASKELLNNWGYKKDEHPMESMLLEGPYIPSLCTRAMWQRLEPLSEPPNKVLIGLLNPDPEKDHSTYTFIQITKITGLPFNFYPTGPGFPYEVMLCGIFNKKPSLTNYFITIDNNLNIHLTKRQSVSYTTRKQKRGFINIPSKTCNIYDPVARGCEFKSPVFQNGKTIATYAINAYLGQSANFCIEASDKRGTVHFGISVEQSKHLFKDRIKVKTSKGRSKPILHWVTAHQRYTGSNVRTHLRGLKRFTWNNIKISIYLPGRDKPIHGLTPILEIPNSKCWDLLFSKANVIKYKDPNTERVFKLKTYSGEEKTGYYYN